jgi:predicted nucleotidyltransferase component of viral defense system
MNTAYFEKQVILLLDVLEMLSKYPSFALKGGTAINFFYADLPRLSVDIDLSYTTINSRADFLRANENFFQSFMADLKERGYMGQTQRTQQGLPKQLSIMGKEVDIKIDVNLILRGTVYLPVTLMTCDRIREKYGKRVYCQVLSKEEVFAGKFCAALDRQHPRDLFDVKLFLEENQITETQKKAFLVYLLSGNRPISEMINPNRLDQRLTFEKEFEGMTDKGVKYLELEKAREDLIEAIDQSLTEADRKFLLSFKKMEPNWDHLGMNHIKDMPAIQWKLYNLRQMNSKKHQLAYEELKRKLEL